MAAKFGYNFEQLQAVFDEIKEVDINPIIVYQQGKGCKVVDARIILES